MDLNKTLATVNHMLSTPKVTPMTRAEFEAYAQAQITKAKEEAEEDKKDDAKKRLEHLRNTLAQLTKAEGSGAPPSNWSGDNGTQLIPEYEHGFEDTTRKGEISETESATPPPGNQGSQADGSSAFAGNQPTYAQPPQSGGSKGTAMPASGAGTQSNNTIFEQSSIGKKLEAITKMLDDATKSQAPVKKNEPVKQPEYPWPRDLAEPEYLKEGVTKRAPDWGTDDTPSK